VKVDQQESETLHSSNFWRFLSLPPDYQRWQREIPYKTVDFPFWVRRYEQSPAELCWFMVGSGAILPNILGFSLVHKIPYIFGVSTGESPSCLLACWVSSFNNGLTWMIWWYPHNKKDSSTWLGSFQWIFAPNATGDLLCEHGRLVQSFVDQASWAKKSDKFFNF
jgi:hypothetical protein